MTINNDDAYPFDWAEYNLPAELLTQPAPPPVAPELPHTDFYPAQRLHANPNPLGPDDMSSDAR